ncbi:PREDICTED: interferon-inducible GTPase 5-like [Gekko japonicus]|uniref:Interferon-inducible GTPase 5-like n=1 Tax=Gekko japonicus TaxID=146911 RepID=A0ABM1KDW0_GEKJA|nr:PREDICTED: interferon-inducible GTPase 5-like [Gekko japonicus]
MGLTISRTFVGKELDELEAASDPGNVPEVATEIHRELSLFKNTILDIAITGELGSGKSSLVNALRGMTDSEEGAAETGVTRTTMEAKGYPHPRFPKITIWDLPGIGMPEFEPEEYLNKVNFSRFDFFIIVAAERLTANHSQLARKIQEMKKTFYFVRSKVDLSMNSERWKPNFSEKQTLEKIRRYCCDNLTEVLETAPSVFLISAWHLDKYDFSLLQEALENEMEYLRKHVLILALPSFSRKILEKNKAALERVIWKTALVSCAIGATPVPGLSLFYTTAMLVTTLKQFCLSFGLDEDSLNRLASRVDKPVEILRAAIKKSPLASEVTVQFVIKILCRSMLCLTLSAVELVLDLAPSTSCLAGGGLSFVTTFYLLKRFLQDLEGDAENVLAKAAEP